MTVWMEIDDLGPEEVRETECVCLFWDISLRWSVSKCQEGMDYKRDV